MNARMAPVELDMTKAIFGRNLDGESSFGWDKRGDGDGKKSGNNKSEDDGKGAEKDHPPGSPQSPVTPSLPPSTFIAAIPTPTAQATLTTTAWTTMSTTVVITSVAPVLSSLKISSSSVAIASISSIASTSSFPTTTSILASITSFTPPVSSSSQPRKGLNTDDDNSSTTSSFTSSCKTKTKSKTTNPIQSTSITALADTEPTATPSSSLDISQKQDHDDDKGRGGLSPTAEHLLIAFGAIGAFILVIAAVYFISRLKNIDLFSKARGREFNKGGSRGWYGWRERESDYTMEEPPKYAVYDNGQLEYLSEQKTVPVQQQHDAFVSQRSASQMATPPSAALSRANTQHNETARQALLENPAPFGMSSTQQPQQSATQAFYNLNPSYNPTSDYSQTYNPNDTSRGLSRQTSDAYDPAQREVNHMSYLSSLSSGFGDQIIIPELGPLQPANGQAPRQSRKFSWATSAREPQVNRDTIYTEASVESSPPRFRTINSWVAQQAGQVERQKQANDEVGNMPSIPKPLQISKMGTAGVHQRNQSEDPAFKHHPGDEIEMSKGARIPSTILDTKFASN